MSRNRQSKTERLRAFEAVVAEYEGRLIRYAARLVSDGGVAQDIVQDAFIRLFKGWKDALHPCPQVSSWLYRVTHNRAIDYLRKESKREHVHRRHAEGGKTFHSPQGDAGSSIGENAERAAMALRGLASREQQLVILKVYEEKSYSEIAEITGLKVGNVGYILHHAMKKMAQKLRHDGVTHNKQDGR